MYADLGARLIRQNKIGKIPLRERLLAPAEYRCGFYTLVMAKIETINMNVKVNGIRKLKKATKAVEKATSAIEKFILNTDKVIKAMQELSETLPLHCEMEVQENDKTRGQENG